jgi:uncharacterized protein (TIGR00266 family)
MSPKPTSKKTVSKKPVSKRSTSRKPTSKQSNKRGGDAGPVPIPSFEIENVSGFDQLNLQLNPGESIISQSGAVAYIDGDLEVSTESENFLTSMFSGTSLFKNHITAPLQGSRAFGLTLAPVLPGSIIDLRITEGKPWILSSGCLLACTPNVQISTDTDFKSVFTSSSVFLVELSVNPGTGDGMVWAHSYGGIKHLQVPEGQKLNIDNGMFIACEKNFKNYNVVPFNKGSLWGSAFSGEGLLMEFTGPADVTVQSRNIVDFINFMKSHMSK